MFGDTGRGSRFSVLTKAKQKQIMETKNLKFNENSVDLTLRYLDKTNYMDTIKAILRCMGNVDKELLTEDERFWLCSLVSEMLPSDEQIMNVEDIERLREYDKKAKTK